MLNSLSKKQYSDTFITPMFDVTETAEALVDIWPHVKLLADENLISSYVLENELVELVYRNGDNTFEHILLPTKDKNEFVVLIINIEQNVIDGHYHLNLKNEYGID